MVKHEEVLRLNLVFHTLADPTRREILYLIANKTHTVSELAKPFNMSLAAICKHLNVLEKAGLLYRSREGRICYCYFDFRPLLEAAQMINQLQASWEQQLNSLEPFLGHTTRTGKKGPPMLKAER